MDLELPVNKNQIIRIGKPEENGVVDNLAIKSSAYIVRKISIYFTYCKRRVIGWCEKVVEKIDLEELKDIDIIIGTFPPMENLFVAYYLSKKLNIPYIAELRDLISDWTETSNGYRPARRLDCAVEKYILDESKRNCNCYTRI